MSARHFEIIKRPGLIVPEAALRRRSICYSGSKPPAMTFEGQSTLDNVKGTHTHSGFNFGAPAPDRVIIAVVNTNTTTSDYGVTSIGGVSPTRLVRTASPIGGFVADILMASVPTGTSGSVVLSSNVGSNLWGSSAAVYRVSGLRNIGATDTATGAATGSVQSTSITVEAQGIVIATVTLQGMFTGSPGWSGVTQDYQVAPSWVATGGSLVATGGATPLLSFTYTGFENGCIAAVALR